MSSDSFTARIRWQADADPAWELETSHDGFVNPEEAAFFANGLTNPAAVELRLDDGRVWLTLIDGSTFELAADVVQVWRLPEDGVEGEDHYPVADDSDFRRVTMTFDELSAIGASHRSSTASSIRTARRSMSPSRSTKPGCSR